MMRLHYGQIKCKRQYQICLQTAVYPAPCTEYQYIPMCCVDYLYSYVSVPGSVIVYMQVYQLQWTMRGSNLGSPSRSAMTEPLAHKGTWTIQSLTLGSFHNLLPPFWNLSPLARATFNQDRGLPLRWNRSYQCHHCNRLCGDRMQLTHSRVQCLKNPLWWILVNKCCLGGGFNLVCPAVWVSSCV